jgi:hypothetical protein
MNLESLSFIRFPLAELSSSAVNLPRLIFLVSFLSCSGTHIPQFQPDGL